MATAGKADKKVGPKELSFIWEGKNKAGKVVRGEIKAVGEAAANAALRRQGVNVTKLKKQKTGSGGKVSDKDITLFSRQLATMVKSGVPLLQSFDIVGKGTNNPALAK
jgi:type IV pilus assembly protein PilC